MATITEDYVSFETAKLLKEKGFNEECSQYYCEGKNELCEWPEYSNDRCLDDEYIAPTQSLAMKWLRKFIGEIKECPIKAQKGE